MAEKGRVFTGARARLSINGVKVGYARNCNGRREIQMDPVEAMDNFEVEENVPVRYRVSFSAGKVRLVGETLRSQGWWPKTGGSPAEHALNIVTQGVMTVTIEDNVTGAVIMTLEQAKAASEDFSVDATGIVGENVDFVAVRMKDETEV